MKPNRFRQALAEGRTPVGHMISEFGTRGIAKILEAAGVDFALFDMEHTGFDLERISDLIAWSKAAPFAPIVRVPQNLYHFLARVMDAGALGVMVANVEDAAAARDIVNAVKYAPLGQRGVGLGGAHNDYAATNPTAYFRESNESTVVICQIESVRGLENAAAIAATEGVDVLWVGHFDLTQSMGIPARFDDPRFLDALRRVVTAARGHGKAVGVQPGDIVQARAWMEMGFNVISWQNDIALYRKALQSAVGEVRRMALARE